MQKNLPWLYAGRALRSFYTSFLTIVFPLYLAQVGLGATRIGLILSLAAGLNILLVAAAGLLADRYGRRTVLIALTAISAAAGFALALSPAMFIVFVLASGLGGVGRGGGAGTGGIWGPILTAEQPLVAASTAGDQTGAFGRFAFIGVLSSAAGSLVGGLPTYLSFHGVPLVAGYRLLFGLSTLLALATVVASMPIREIQEEEPPRTAGSPPVIPIRTLLGRLGLTNALNGFGIGFLGPLLTYWFYRRFGVGAAEIAVLYTIVNLVTALPYLGAAGLARRLGQVRAVVLTRIMGSVVLMAMPFMPSLFWAGTLYALRMGLNSLSLPARQSFTMGIAAERYRSRVAAFSWLPSQVTSMVSPVVGGAAMESFLDFPIYGAALFMLANAVSYYFAFRHAEVPGEPAAS